MTLAPVLDVGVRSRFAGWLETVLPWYDRDREAAKYAQFEKQIDTSRKVRVSAQLVISSSRRDRRDNMRESFRAAGRHLGAR